MVSFLGRTDVRGVRYRETDKQTDRPNYCNPRCACAPRVNDWTTPHVYMRTAVGFRHSVYTVLPGSPRGYMAENTPAIKKAATRIYSREHPCYQKTPPLGYIAENTPAMKKRRHSDIWHPTQLWETTITE